MGIYWTKNMESWPAFHNTEFTTNKNFPAGYPQPSISRQGVTGGISGNPQITPNSRYAGHMIHPQRVGINFR